ncbi:MAG: hypothetical protein ACM3UW_02400 [Bacillota bacterium]
MLNRIAPLFFRPRSSRTIRLNEIGLEAREIHIPLGSENWDFLDQRIGEQFGQKVKSLCRKQDIESLGITRNLRTDRLSSLALEGRRGDKFIVVLALLKIEEILGRIRAQRVILVSDQELAYCLAVKVSERFKLPVSLQTVHPAQHESMALRMLHQEGLALSLAALKPARWQDEDIVIVLDESYAGLAKGNGNGWRINLADSSRGHAPELEMRLQRQGLDPALCNLAPLMETYLLHKKNPGLPDIIPTIEEKGGRIWEYFLDKEWGGHYNTIKGF